MLGVTKGISSWNTQNNNVERLMDNAAYTSAHPDDTLVLAGPPRFNSVDLTDNSTSAWQTLLAIGMLQTFQISSQKPTQPMQAIGSGRAFFVSGKSMTTWRIGRLLTNGRNLLRVLYHNAVAGGVQVQHFDDPVVPQTGGTSHALFFCNLDSELFYVPFGLGVLFKDKTSQALGSFYVELAMISTYTIGFTSGQNMVLEDVGGMCDRLVPFHTSTMLANVHVPRSSMDLVIGFAGGTEATGVLSGSADWAAGFGD